jgi:phosphatidylethanolamine-binding protein (PEBP) family uncharacterized protein
MRLVVWYILCGKNKNQFYMFTLISIIMNAMLTVTSPAFGANTMIPIKYTCEGASVSPALHIGEFPAQAMNGAHKAGYIGPCPPTGVHHYHFMVYALDTRLDLGDQAGKAELEKAMEGHILAQGDLVGLYKKTK